MTSFLYTFASGGVIPKSGSYMAASAGTYAALSQTVHIPVNAPYLRFSYRIVGSRSCSSGSSVDYVWVYTDAATVEWYLETCNTEGWVTGTLDLTSEAGSTRQIFFEVATDIHGGTVYFDDIGFVSGPTREVDYY